MQILSHLTEDYCLTRHSDGRFFICREDVEGIYDLQGDLVLKKQRLVGAGPAALILWIIQAESVPRIKWLGKILEEGDKACNMLRNVLVAQMKSGEVCSFAETFYDSQTG